MKTAVETPAKNNAIRVARICLHCSHLIMTAPPFYFCMQIDAP